VVHAIILATQGVEIERVMLLSPGWVKARPHLNKYTGHGGYMSVIPAMYGL
jgi:hypothetical protein